ncbi:MAG: hypothetical protein MR581_02985 [Lachnospiraceae bacterium]|nr:hypothetical protein [Lachnospiraceae bacterium]HBB61356.1 hypothetical protein [Lachnospiraceae bacterium]
MGIYEERLERIEAAVALEPVDKVPVISGLAAVAAPMTHTNVSDFLKDMELNCTCNIEATKMLGNVDGVQTTLSSPEGLPTLWLSNIGVPGEDIPDNQLWQVKEKELMTQEDYDIILRDGFEPWYLKFMKEKLRDPLTRMKPIAAYGPTAKKRFEEAGYVVIKNSSLLTPFEMLCGGRSLEAFLIDDLMEIPEKVDAVFSVIHHYNMNRYQKLFESPSKPYGVWIGGWRGTPETLNPSMFQRFNWKYFRELIDLCIQYHVLPILHLDACWDLGLSYFKDITPKKAVMALDGKTDIHKAKEVVGNTMCIMGDVPASMIAFSKPQDIYDYTMNLIRTVGPRGYMVCSGCDIPFNGKVENMQMMAKAADDAANK